MAYNAEESAPLCTGHFPGHNIAAKSCFASQGIAFHTASRRDVFLGIRRALWQMQRLVSDENALKVTTWILTGWHVPIANRNREPGKDPADQR